MGSGPTQKVAIRAKRSVGAAPVVGTPPDQMRRKPKPVDIKSPEYKAASRKWTSLMVALPILAVTSYYLFDRRMLLYSRIPVCCD